MVPNSLLISLNRMLISAASKPIDIFKYVYTHSDGKEALKFHDVSEDEVRP